MQNQLKEGMLFWLVFVQRLTHHAASGEPFILPQYLERR